MEMFIQMIISNWVPETGRWQEFENGGEDPLLMKTILNLFLIINNIQFLQIFFHTILTQTMTLLVISDPCIEVAGPSHERML